MHKSSTSRRIAQRRYSGSRRTARWQAAAAAAFVAAGWGLEPASAADKTWAGSHLGFWNTVANWAPAGVPTANDDVLIDLPHTVRLSGAGVAASLNMTAANMAEGPRLLPGNHTLTIGGDVTLSGINTGISIGPLSTAPDSRLIIDGNLALNDNNFVGDAQTAAAVAIGATTAQNNAAAVVIGRETSSVIDIRGNSSMQGGTFSIGTRVAPGSSYLINIEGSARIEQSAASALTIGHGTLGSGSTVVNIGTAGGFGAAFNTGEGAVTIARTAQINIGADSVSSGVLNARGNTTLSGLINVNPTGSLNLSAGRTLTVQNQGVLNLNRDFTVGPNRTFSAASGATINANGNLIVSGGTLSAGAATFNLAAGRNLTVQNGGRFTRGAFGPMNIHQGSTFRATGGGLINIGHLDVGGPGSSGSGTLIVEGAGSRLAALLPTSASNQSHRWGADGHNATIHIRDGASAEVVGGLLMASDGSNASATLTVDGPGTRFEQTNVAVGAAPDQVIIGHASAGSAILNVRNGASFTSEAGTTGASKLILNNTGQIHVTSGGFFETAIIERNGGTINLDGGTIRFNNIQGNLTNQAGTVVPGYRSENASSISGNYTQQPGATLAVDIAGVVPGQTSRLGAAGNAVLSGTIDLNIIDDFVPIIGNSFTVVQTIFGNVGGTFDRVEGALPLPGIGLAVTYEPKEVIVRAALPGDANLDGVVNLSDFNALAANFGLSGRTWIHGDFTGDGIVNLADFNRLAANFGLSAGPNGLTPDDWAALAAAVPEPGVALLPGLVVLALGRRRRPRRRHAAPAQPGARVPSRS